MLESELGGRDVGPDPDTLSACRVAGVLKQFPDPARAQRTAVVLDAVEVLEDSLRRVVYENLVPGILKFFGHLRVSTGQVLRRHVRWFIIRVRYGDKRRPP